MATAKKQLMETEEQLRKTVISSTDQAVADVRAIYDNAQKQAESHYRQVAADTEKSYRSAYDANVVNELIARRNAEEAMARAGLSKSGLNATNQTAISLSRANADHQTTLQKQAAVDAIMRELDNVKAQYHQQQITEESTIRQQAADNEAAASQAENDRLWEEYLINLKHQNEMEASAAQRQWQTSEAVAAREHDTYSRYIDYLLDTQQKRYVQSMNTGTIGAVDSTYSTFAIKMNAWNIKRQEGDLQCQIYLTQAVNNGYITPEQKSSLMGELGVRYVQKPTKEAVHSVAQRIQKNDGDTAARDYIQTLYDLDLIGIRDAESLYDQLGV